MVQIIQMAEMILNISGGPDGSGGLDCTDGPVGQMVQAVLMVQMVLMASWFR
jgi:hypothetical protein